MMLEQGGSSGVGKKWLECGYFLKVNLRGWADGSDVGYEKRGVKESSLTPGFFGLSHWWYLLTCGILLHTSHCLISSHHCEGGLAYIRMRMTCKGFNCRSIPSSYLASRDTLDRHLMLPRTYILFPFKSSGCLSRWPPLYLSAEQLVRSSILLGPPYSLLVVFECVSRQAISVLTITPSLASVLLVTS